MLGLIYELLYGKVFDMEDIDTAVQVMLYEGKPPKDRGEVFRCSTSAILREVTPRFADN